MSKSVFISAGHSNSDPGAVATHGGVRYTEEQIVREFRNDLVRLLRERGMTVRTDGEGQTNRTLNEAVASARQNRDLDIEFHLNSFGNPSATGVECISLPDKRSQSQRISTTIANILGLPLRGQGGWIDQSKSARGRLAFVEAGGIIVELFFLSNPNDLQRFQQRRGDLIAAVANTIQQIA